MISQNLVTLATGEARINVTVAYTPPQPPTGSPGARPRVSKITSTVETTGGSISGDQNVYYFLTALDASGKRSIRSLPIEVVIPAGTNTNEVVLTGRSSLIFDCNQVTYEVYRAYGDPHSIFRIASNQTIPSGAWTFTDTGSANDGTLPPEEHILTHRVYWRKTGDTLWNLGATATDRTQSSLSFLVPYNLSGQSIDVQVRGVGLGGQETPQGIATTKSFALTAQYPSALGIGGAPTSNPLSYNGNDIIDTSGIVVARAVDFSRSYVNKTMDYMGEGSTFRRGSNALFAGYGGLPTTSAFLTASDAGSSETISVASFDFKYPTADGSGRTVTYNSGSITGLAYTTTYFVYCDDPTQAGGAVTYYATTNPYDLSAAYGRVFVGKITTGTSGGSGTSGSGGGGGGGGLTL